ncbi:hypothetical protein POM88_032827 [Heracleum sosnowskyi]|uniref:Uncharacterized protein n=1 Tax=Heracleum sosnowskyi TaxID=360622 RepID=A0AAD8I1B4_9APIA|nr:hypothetical protein POM88_032827 [Heracleum sosnowskyi]
MTYPSTFAPPPPSLFTIPPPTNNSDDGSYLPVLIIVGAIVFIFLIFGIKCFWKKYKDDSKGTTKSDAFEIDLESGLHGREGDLESELSDEERSSSKVVANQERQFKKSKRGKKNVKKIPDHEDMVHGYDKRLSSSKVGANYSVKPKNTKFGARQPESLDSDIDNRKRSNADEGHTEFSSESEGHVKFNLEDESRSEDEDAGHIKFSSEDESSSEEEDSERHRGSSSKVKTIRNKQSKQVKYVEDTPKYNAFKGDTESGYYNKRLSRSKDEAFRNGKSKKRRSARAGRPE